MKGYWTGMAKGEKRLLLTAAGHPEGMAHVGRATGSARRLVKRGFVIMIGREDVQITDDGEALAKRMVRNAPD